MGASLSARLARGVTVGSLRPEMEVYRFDGAALPAEMLARRMRMEGCFGWGVRRERFEELMAEDRPAGAADAEWAVWDPENTGQASVLEMCAAALVVCKATFDAKVNALHRTFDFEGRRALSPDETIVLLRTAVTGLLKAAGEAAATPADDADIQLLAMDAVAFARRRAEARGASGKLNRPALREWARGNDAVRRLLCAVGTTDAQEVVPAATATRARQPAAGRKERRDTIAARRAAPKKATRRPAVWHGGRKKQSKKEMATKKRFKNVENVRVIRFIFDRIDADGSGSISRTELERALKSNVAMCESSASSMFASLDADDSGLITFEEILHIIYPYAKPSEVKDMVALVSPPPVRREHLELLRQAFEAADGDCAGRAPLGELLAALPRVDGCTEAQRHTLQQYVEGRARRYRDTSSVTFRQLLAELFSKSHTARMDHILRDAPEVRTLTRHQLHQVEHLYSLYDLDQNGTVSLDELREVVSRVGLPAADVDGLFLMFDTNGDNQVDLDEFKAVFRRVWNSRGTGEHSTSHLRFRSLEPRRVYRVPGGRAGGSDSEDDDDEEEDGSEDLSGGEWPDDEAEAVAGW